MLGIAVNWALVLFIAVLSPLSGADADWPLIASHNRPCTTPSTSAGVHDIGPSLSEPGGPSVRMPATLAQPGLPMGGYVPTPSGPSVPSKNGPGATPQSGSATNRPCIDCCAGDKATCTGNLPPCK